MFTAHLNVLGMCQVKEIVSTKFPETGKIYSGYRATNGIEYGSSASTADYSLNEIEYGSSASTADYSLNEIEYGSSASTADYSLNEIEYGSSASTADYSLA